MKTGKHVTILFKKNEKVALLRHNVMSVRVM